MGYLCVSYIMLYIMNGDEQYLSEKEYSNFLRMSLMQVVLCYTCNISEGRYLLKN